MGGGGVRDKLGDFETGLFVRDEDRSHTGKARDCLQSGTQEGSNSRIRTDWKWVLSPKGWGSWGVEKS